MRREEDPEENPDNHQHLRSRKKEPNKETGKEPPESEEHQGHRSHGKAQVS